MSRICVPIVGPSAEEAQRQLKDAEGCADLVEFWVEPLETPLPVIYKITHIEQKKLLVLEPDYVDIDESLCEQLIPHCSAKTRVICSTHDFERMPDLEKTLERLRRHRADFYKIAAMAHSAVDALRMLEFVKKHPNLIGVAMGEAGQAARILTPTVSDLWVYAALKTEEATAPGQLTVDEYYQTLSRKTKVYGVMGDPVCYSPGPRFHNQIFQKENRDAVYVRFLVRKGEAAEFLDLATALNVRGLSVTMPLKEEVIPGQVVNTLTQETEWAGDNTDGPGAVDCLMPVSGKKIALLGRGGASQAIQAEAERRGAEVAVFNRNFERLKSFEYDMVINCTPVGMDPESEEMPIEASMIRPGSVVMDIVSGKRETPLVRAAREKGCQVISGWEMYVNQALRQQKRWFGKENPNFPRESFKWIPAGTPV